MKYILIGLLFASQVGFASQEFRVIDRQDHSTKTYYKKVSLKDLISDTHFEGKYFKIVHKKSNEPISFSDPDPQLVQKAANTYYHLTQAKDFWLNNLQVYTPESFPQLTIRLEITNTFSELGHYSHDNFNPQYNNALSIPEGQTPEWVPVEKQDKWGKEIWFRPKKVISTKELTNTLGPNPVSVALKQMHAPFINYTVNQFTKTLIDHLFYSAEMTTSLRSDFSRFLGTIALSYFVVESSKKMDPLFMEKWFYLDTSMVPEVIYHEYAHLILSDHLEMSHSTPVIEGYADYFAAIMSEKKKVYAKVPGHSNANPKDPYNDRPYNHMDEHISNATSDFVLSVLWDVRETLGKEVGDKVIFESRKKLNTKTATISHHMLKALLETCSEICPSPRKDRLKLYQTFSKRGF
ncbi:MAG TPA: hypothetical protein VKY27_09620 [Bacteriovoracaceae bacterium]|nr:hypothetical protein [Bacteriovoracaceae bacterium]HLW57632.1 hypothetical protein [Bacteriovoracaceae bacterium]